MRKLIYAEAHDDEELRSLESVQINNNNIDQVEKSLRQTMLRIANNNRIFEPRLIKKS